MPTSIKEGGVYNGVAHNKIPIFEIDHWRIEGKPKHTSFEMFSIIIGQ